MQTAFPNIPRGFPRYLARVWHVARKAKIEYKFPLGGKVCSMYAFRTLSARVSGPEEPCAGRALSASWRALPRQARAKVKEIAQINEWRDSTPGRVDPKKILNRFMINQTVNSPGFDNVNL